MRSFIALAALSLASTVVACSASSEEGVGSSEANITDAKPLEVVKGREYARCWFDVIGSNAQLSCTSTARGSDPLGVTVEVVATAMVPNTPGAVDGLQFTPLSRKLDIEAGGTVVVGSLPLTAFPLMSFWIHAQLSGESIKAVGLEKVPDYYNHVKVTRPGDLTQANPAIIKQVYDLWPMAFIDARGDWSGYVVHAEYTRSIAPYAGSFDSDKEMSLNHEFFSTENKGKVVWFVAPENGTLALRVQGAGKENVTVTGPGYYVSTSDDFRLATPEEVAIDFKSTTNAPGGTTTEPTPGITTEPTPEPVPTTPVDPTPGCGGNGEATCSNPRSCDEGTRLDNGKCTTCGTNGNLTCYKDPDGTSSTSGTYCTAGTRLDNGKCTTCGTAGQIACYKDPDGTSSTNGTVCNAGLRIQNGTCVQ